jgi:hypothetical protein
MEHIAYVVDGEWIAEGQRQHRLARTPKVIAKRRQEDREQTLADVARDVGERKVPPLRGAAHARASHRAHRAHPRAVA